MAAKAAGKAKADSDATGAAKKPARQKAAAKKATAKKAPAKKATAKKTTSKKTSETYRQRKTECETSKGASAATRTASTRWTIGGTSRRLAEARGALREREAARVFAEAAETHQQGDLVEGH
mgnify:CR=1 FL=1